MPLKITGYSTALFASWYFVDEYGVLFDCGDGVCATLLQKARKIKHVFVSHADRDHVNGLLQFQQLNGRSELQIHFPKNSGSFPALAEFTTKFDPHVSGTKPSTERLRVAESPFRSLASTQGRFHGISNDRRFKTLLVKVARLSES